MRRARNEFMKAGRRAPTTATGKEISLAYKAFTHYNVATYLHPLTIRCTTSGV
jgi:hypothetical protein